MATAHDKIDLAIRLIALVKLALGILIIAVPFKIIVHDETSDHARPIMIWYMFGFGAMVILTSLVVIVNYTGTLTLRWFPTVNRYKGLLSTVFVFLSMVSALVAVTEKAGVEDCWFYCIGFYEPAIARGYLVTTSIIVGLCVIQHMTIFIKWTLEVMSNIENPTIEHNPGSECLQQSRLQDSSAACTAPVLIGMRNLKNYHQQPTHQQTPPQGCDYRCSLEGQPSSSAAPPEANSRVPAAENHQNPEIEN